MKLYLEEALYHAKYLGIKDPKQQILSKLSCWKNAKRPMANLDNVIFGRTEAKPEIIKVFCEVCKVEPNFIYHGPEK
jgi:hypothetical protein